MNETSQLTEKELRSKIVRNDYLVGKYYMDYIHDNLSPEGAEKAKIAKQELQGATDNLLIKYQARELTETNLIEMEDKLIINFPHPSGSFIHRQIVPDVGPKTPPEFQK